MMILRETSESLDRDNDKSDSWILGQSILDSK